MFQELLFQQIFIISKLFIFPEINALNLSLFASFFSNNIELCDVNYILKSALQKLMDLFSPIKYYNE